MPYTAVVAPSVVVCKLHQRFPDAFAPGRRIDGYGLDVAAAGRYRLVADGTLQAHQPAAAD